MMKLGPGSYGKDKSWFLRSLGSEACKRKKAKPKPKLESQAKLASKHARTHAQNRRNKDPREAATKKRKREGNEEDEDDGDGENDDDDDDDDDEDDEKGSQNVHQVLLFSLYFYHFSLSLIFFPILYYISFNGTANFQRFKKI